MATKRSDPTPRPEGMANIIAATLRLLESHPPQDITLRDVATESGHGHRLIVEWFGGKGGLFAAVIVEIFQRLTTTGELFYADVPIRPDVRRAFQVFNYMHMHHPDFVDTVRDRFVLGTLQERLRTNLGLPEGQARRVAERLAVLALGIANFRDLFDMSDDEFVQLMQDEFKTTTGFDLPARPPRT